MRFLVAESETADERGRRRADVGLTAGGTYADTLRGLVPEATIDLIAPTDVDTECCGVASLARYDAVFITGSTLHVYDGAPATERLLAFMRRVFASGTPSFGSCAGLQLAVAAAGGRVGPLARQEAGIVRRITRTDEGRDHPLLAGRALVWDAAALHGDAVEELPDEAIALATNAVARVQAAEIRSDEGVFWGVQYHPELPLTDIAAALRHSADDVVEAGLALNEAQVEAQAALIEALGERPDRVDLHWRLGVDAEVADPARRSREIANFIEHLVIPTRARRLVPDRARAMAV